MTFVAFGTLIVAAALPANADTVLHGSANAAVAGHVLYLDGTPQGETNSNSQDFDEQVESYLSVNAEASDRVDGDDGDNHNPPSGGAAACLVRPKKKNNEGFNETDES